MDVFRIHQRLLEDYRAFTSGFVDVRDPRLRTHVQEQLVLLMTDTKHVIGARQSEVR